MKTYSIIGKTNAYIAQFDPKFGKSTRVVLESGLTLKEAHKKLLDMYNRMFECERPYAANWGLAVIQSAPCLFGACKTFQDGTRTFDYDSRTYTIEEEEMEEEC